jgi:hypothetical protein
MALGMQQTLAANAQPKNTLGLQLQLRVIR